MEHDTRERFRLLEEQMKRVAEALAREEQEKQKAEALNVLRDVVTAAFDKMSTYTSLVVIGGYAAFFSVWAAVEEFISPSMRLWSFGLIAASVILFLASEVYRVTQFSSTMRNVWWQLNSAPAAEFKVIHARFTQAHAEKILKTSTGRAVVHWATIVCGGASASLLLFAVGKALFERL